MLPQGSSVPGFKEALEARWKANPAFKACITDKYMDGLTVSWGNPHPQRLTNCLLIIDDTSGHELEYVAAMTQANETYDVRCFISIENQVRNDRKRMWDTAYALYAAAVSDIVAWNKSGTMKAEAGVDIVMVKPGHDQDAIEGDRREVSITFDLHVTARIAL